MKEKDLNEVILEDLDNAEIEPLEDILPSGTRAEASTEAGGADALSLEVAEWKDRYMRQAAELENYKKRNEREKADFLRRANESLLKDLLPVLDNLERALGHASEATEEGSLYQGLKLISTEIGKILNRYGLEPLDVLNKPFDPNSQEAIMQQPDNSVPENTVVGQMQKGYMFHGRVLRPALVVVSKKG